MLKWLTPWWKWQGITTRIYIRKKHDVSLDGQNFFLNKIDKFLTAKQKADLDSDITLEELEKALLNSNKTKKTW